MPVTSAASLSASPTVWSRVDDGFYVANRDGNFLGYVDRHEDGRFLACDLYSRPLGVEDDLTSAMAIVAAREAADPSADTAGTELDD